MEWPHAARKLKADTRFKQIPIIALTASTKKTTPSRRARRAARTASPSPSIPRQFAQQIFAFPARSNDDDSGQLPALGRESLILLIVDDYAADRRCCAPGSKPKGMS